MPHVRPYEKEMVKLKCARWATKDELETCCEKIKWFDDQRKRIINGDKMSFGLDTDSNNLFMSFSIISYIVLG